MNQSEAKREALKRVLDFAKELKKEKIASKMKKPDEQKEKEADPPEEQGE